MRSAFLLFALLICTNLSAQDKPVSFEQIEVPPLYEGCATLPISEQKDCTRDKIEAFIKERFNTGLFNSINFNEKRIRVYAQFVIDKAGNAKDINVRTVLPSLEKETKKLIELLPNLSPGKNNGKLVETQITIPFVFTLG